MATLDLYHAAAELRRAALLAADPAEAVRRHVRRVTDWLLVGDTHYHLTEIERVFVVAIGQASMAMADAIADFLDDKIADSVIVTQPLPASHSPRSTLIGGHPVPNEDRVRAGQRMAQVLGQARESDLVVCLISAGASALATHPVEGATLADLQALTEGLLRSGATVNELDGVRKHLDRVKGGGIARMAGQARVLSLILSDVVGGPPDVMASGPTAPDVQNVIVGSNRQAAQAAVKRAEELGFNALLLSTFIEGEACEVARVAAALAKEVIRFDQPIKKPACWVWGGRTTVTVRGKGQGGRNQELALAAAIALDGWPGVLIQALGTDGADGPTGAAGAIATGETVSRARAIGLDAAAMLADDAAYHFFAQLGDQVITGPTGANVNDLVFILVA